MPITREEVLKLQEMKQEKELKARQAANALLKQASLKVEYVTKNEHWDYFLQLLQAKLDEAKHAEIEWMKATAIANEAKDFHIAQRQYLAMAERVKTLEEVMSLPITLMQAAQ